MKRAAILAAVLTFAPVMLRAESVHSEKSFQNGGRVQMHLSGGDYEVRAGSSDKIVVTASADDESKKVKADIIVNDDVAKIRTAGPHSNFHVVIEVPPETHLYIRLSAGDMRVKGISGNKDIETHAGDLDIDAGDPNSYGQVDVSVKVGDLNPGPFDASKGASRSGFFRSLRQTRKGQLRLHAHVGAGDLNLH